MIMIIVRSSLMSSQYCQTLGRNTLHSIHGHSYNLRLKFLLFYSMPDDFLSSHLGKGLAHVCASSIFKVHGLASSLVDLHLYGHVLSHTLGPEISIFPSALSQTHRTAENIN